MTSRQPLSSVDTAWLRMDRPSNRMMIAAVMVCDGELPYERFKRTIASRFLRHRRFRQRVVMQGNSAYWETDPHFELGLHVMRTALPRPAGRQELYDLVSALISTPLDPHRPLWQFHVVDAYNGGSALVARIHHCYADGVALMRVLMSMTDDSSTETASIDDPVEHEEEQAADLVPQWLAPLAKTLNRTIAAGGGLLSAYVDAVLHPTHALDYARQGIDLAAEATRLALMPTDSRTRFKGRPTGSKRAAWSKRLPLHEIKAVAHASGCSINDVLLSCTAGALRAYLIGKADPVDQVELRGLVPVNLRPTAEGDALGNYFGLVAVLLPLGIDNPIERLYQVKNRMLELKVSSQAQVTLGLLAAVGMGPKALQEQILDLLANRASAVITNVPGPQRPLYLAGARIAEIVFWVPQSAAIGMGISLLSYDNGVQFGIVTDRSLVGDPDAIASLFAEQFDQLLWITLMGSWDRPPSAEEAAKLLQ